MKPEQRVELLRAIDEAVWAALRAGLDREAVIAEVRYALDVAEDPGLR